MKGKELCRKRREPIPSAPSTRPTGEPPTMNGQTSFRKTGVPAAGVALAAILLLTGIARAEENIPLPEHPRPDFERAAWVNLNGAWQFRFDANDEGLAQRWQEAESGFPLTIKVPFPW